MRMRDVGVILFCLGLTACSSGGSLDVASVVAPPALSFAATNVQAQSNNLDSANFTGSCVAGATITVTLNGVTDGTTTCHSNPKPHKDRDG